MRDMQGIAKRTSRASETHQLQEEWRNVPSIGSSRSSITTDKECLTSQHYPL